MSSDTYVRAGCISAILTAKWEWANCHASARSWGEARRRNFSQEWKAAAGASGHQAVTPSVSDPALSALDLLCNTCFWRCTKPIANWMSSVFCLGYMHIFKKSGVFCHLCTNNLMHVHGTIFSVAVNNALHEHAYIKKSWANLRPYWQLCLLAVRKNNMLASANHQHLVHNRLRESVLCAKHRLFV